MTAVTLAGPRPRDTGAMTIDRAGAEELDTSTAIVGDDLMLCPDGDGAYTLFDLSDGRPRRVGIFEDVVAAWEAVDALDG